MLGSFYAYSVRKILNMLDFKVILDEVLSPLWQSRLSYVDDDLV
jgi:hypothetical protein